MLRAQSALWSLIGDHQSWSAVSLLSPVPKWCAFLYLSVLVLLSLARMQDKNWIDTQSTMRHIPTDGDAYKMRIMRIVALRGCCSCAGSSALDWPFARDSLASLEASLASLHLWIEKIPEFFFVIISGRRRHGRWLIVEIDACAFNVLRWIDDAQNGWIRCEGRSRLLNYVTSMSECWTLNTDLFIWVVICIVAYILSRVADYLPARWLCFLVNRKDKIVKIAHTRETRCSIVRFEALTCKCIQQVSVVCCRFVLILIVKIERETHFSNAMLEDAIHIRMVPLPVHCLRSALKSSLKCPKSNVIVKFFLSCGTTSSRSWTNAKNFEQWSLFRNCVRCLIENTHFIIMWMVNCVNCKSIV